MSLETRVTRLEQQLQNGGDCPVCSGDPTELLVYCPQAGDPKPEIPICPKCGQPRSNVRLIEEVIVDSREELERLREENPGAGSYQ
jgi:hypothetical protein